MTRHEIIGARAHRATLGRGLLFSTCGYPSAQAWMAFTDPTKCANRRFSPLISKE